MSFNIAIDGPAGAGKSTIARRLAEKISFIYVDTGAMYRAMAYYFLTHQISAEDEDALRKACDDIQIELSYRDGVQNVILNGEDISGKIRKEEVGNMASATSGYSFVREKLLSLQQDLAARNNVIMDGRDIGTVVLPDATVKIYLTAAPEARARRRWLELKEKGSDITEAQVLEDVLQRDYNDTHREIAPLRQAEDAVLVDTTALDLEASYQLLLNTIRERI